MASRFLKYIAAPLTLLALSGCADESDRISKPEKKQFENYSALFNDKTYGPVSIADKLIKDLDDDGEADIIHFGRNVEWIAQGIPSAILESQEIKSIKGHTKIMTPEIRAAATRELKAEQNLAYLIAEENYRLQEEKKDKK